MQTVTAALIEADGKVLLALRRAGKHMGRRWELPGGKVDPGEDPRDALSRELEEEFGVRAEIGQYLGSTRFRTRGLDLRIHLYRVGGFQGALQLREHEEIRWVDPGRVQEFDLVDSDRRLLRKFRKELTSKPY